MGEPLVSFQSVSKRYGAGPAILEAVDLVVEPGDFISLIGPSGCGKTTLLRLVAGLTPLSLGRLSVFGLEPGAAGDRQAFIFQEATLLPWRAALQNVELPLRLRGTPARERVAHAQGLLGLVGLADVADFYPRQLSGGMKMRVSLARALITSPELLLFDEPFGALDEMSRHHLNEELLDLRGREPFTGLFVTHSVAEAVFLSNRILVMAARPGRVLAEVRVDFGVKRTAALRSESAFQAKVGEVTALLHSVEVGGRP